MNGGLNLKKFIATYGNNNIERFNQGVIDRTADQPLKDHILAAFKSLEVLENIEVVGHSYTENVQEISSEFQPSRKSKKNKKKGEEENRQYLPLNESNYGEITINFKLTVDDEVKYIDKKLLMPVQDEDGYLLSKGTRYFMMYQLVDASTYVRKKTLTLKSLMPVGLTRRVIDFVDTEGKEHTAPTYMYKVYKKDVDVLIFFFAKMGMSETLRFMNVDKAMFLSPNDDDRENYSYFYINSKIYLAVDKRFTKYAYVMSMAFMILTNVTNRLSIEQVDDKAYWLERIGSIKGGKQYSHLEKGRNSLTYFDRMLDENTRDVLKIDKRNKKNIYTIVRWMIQNYSDLRKKDDLSLENKRLRCNEYIAALLTKELNKRLNRIIGFGSKLKMENLEDLLKFPENILIRSLHKSGLFRFDERINDMDFFARLKYTLKGPNSLGGKNSKNMSVKYRGLHPSYLGNIDINVCGSSDPGSSGLLTPFVKTNGLYFSDKKEPQDGVFDYEQSLLKEIPNDIEFVETFNNKEEEFEKLDELAKFLPPVTFTKKTHE